eukprot:TRINITY_DN1079_c0_g1_i1.p1 TRINITY_DN1079_c0_g1~~TRINITY_DN1079_c0_g1_i1.p1  ORF type:complete len:342 (+),score=68.35 TRINITY_DN1079_c0_g1_i1:275-1300(+)
MKALSFALIFLALSTHVISSTQNIYLYGFDLNLNNIPQYTENLVKLTVPLDPAYYITSSPLNISIVWDCYSFGCGFFQGNSFFDTTTNTVYLANSISQPNSDKNIYVISSISLANNVVRNLTLDVFPIAITTDFENNLYILSSEVWGSGNSSIYCYNLNTGSFYSLGSTQTELDKTLAWDYKKTLYAVSITNDIEYGIAQMSMYGGEIYQENILGNYSIHGLVYSTYYSMLVAVMCTPSHYISDTVVNYNLALIDPISNDYQFIANLGNFSDISTFNGPSGTAFDNNSNIYYAVVLDMDISGNEYQYLFAVEVNTSNILVNGQFMPQDYDNFFFSPFVMGN